eukprot:3092029-Amphidinium_carterae.1
MVPHFRCGSLGDGTILLAQWLHQNEWSQIWAKKKLQHEKSPHFDLQERHELTGGSRPLSVFC